MKKGVPIKPILKKCIPSPPLSAALVAAIIMILALMVPPVVGMADNGDFYRISNGQGIYKLDRYEDDQYFSYASTNFGVYQYYNEYEEGLVSSQTPFILAAKGLDSIFTQSPDVFDIRFMGVLLILYCAAAIYFLVDYATYKVNRIASYLIAALSVFIFADTGYTAYFNSFYAEGIAMVSFVFMMVCALLIAQRRYSAYGLLALFAVNAIILTTSKQQNAPLGVLAGIMLIILCFMVLARKKSSIGQEEAGGDMQKNYIKRSRVFQITAVACGTVLCLAGVATYLLIPKEFVNINAYHAMTRGVMMTAENPEKALEEFDIDPQYALLNKSIYYDRNPVIDVESEILQKDFYSHYNFLSITSYYLRHPGQLMQMLDLAARNAWTVRPASIGNYDRGAGLEPGAQTHFFTYYTSFKDTSMPRTIGFIVVWTAVLLVFGCKNKKRDVILAFAIAMGLSQFFVSIIGAGDADLSKHIFLFGVSFDFASFISISALIAYLAQKISVKKAKRKPALPQEETEAEA